MQGRLIAPVLAHLAPFVGAAQEDNDFLEPPRATSVEGATVTLPCQVEPDELEGLELAPNGNAPRTRVHLVFHQRDLAMAGVQPKTRDRLLSITTLRGEAIPGFEQLTNVYATEARPLSFGFSRCCATANLLRITFEDRSQAARRFA